jgi:nitrogen regulatory protein P-II 1
MKLLFIVLNKEEFLPDILPILAELNISGATILDSEGMAHALAYDVPIFAGLRQMLGETKRNNKTIFTLIENDAVLTELHNILKEEGIDFEKKGMGIMFTVPVDQVIK